MSKKLLIALLLIGLTVIVLLLNRGSVQVNLVVTSISALKSLVFLCFLSLGVVIGVLLK